MTKEQIKAAQATEIRRKKFMAQQELKRLNAEKRDALDRDDIAELKSLNRMTGELNAEIDACNKAIRELEAE